MVGIASRAELRPPHGRYSLSISYDMDVHVHVKTGVNRKPAHNSRPPPLPSLDERVPSSPSLDERVPPLPSLDKEGAALGRRVI